MLWFCHGWLRKTVFCILNVCVCVFKCCARARAPAVSNRKHFSLCFDHILSVSVTHMRKYIYWCLCNVSFLVFAVVCCWSLFDIWFMCRCRCVYVLYTNIHTLLMANDRWLGSVVYRLSRWMVAYRVVPHTHTERQPHHRIDDFYLLSFILDEPQNSSLPLIAHSVQK